MKNKRKDKIKQILKYLESQDIHENTQAIDIKENLFFFKSIQFFSSFILWYFRYAFKKNNSKIAEFTDFCNEQFNAEFYVSLAKLERGFFPGLIKPLVKRIQKKIRDEKIATVLVLGSGPMEIERQIISNLIKNKNKKPYCFIGIDQSKSAQQAAISNLEELKDNVQFIKCNAMDIEKMIRKTQENNKIYTIILCNDDVFSLQKNENDYKFDLVVSSLFIHHLDEKQKVKFEQIVLTLSDNIIEYDGYRKPLVFLLQTLFTWRNPILMNGAAFSNLRYEKKKTLKQISKKWKMKFFLKGTYIKEFCSKG